MPKLQDIFVEQGALRELAGNAVLRLDDRNCAGLVECGRVEVFAIPWAGSEPAGARMHLATLAPGQMLFGATAEGLSLGLLAVGIPGTRVRQLPRARLMEFAEDEPLAVDLVCALERWTEGLSAAVACEQPPRHAQVLTEGECCRPQAGMPLRAGHQTLWLGGDGGSFRFLGRIEVAREAGELFPLCPSGWIVAPPETNVVAGSTRPFLGNPRLWSGLDRFHETILRAVSAAAEESVARERERLEGRDAADQRVRRETIDELGGVLQAPSAVATRAAATDDPLLAACRLVGQRMGISVQSPRAGRGGGDRVGAIARASGVRVRRVLLSGDWWRKDSGPLVAFAKDDGRPLALLPLSPGRYERVDPAQGVRAPVDRQTAAGVQPFAYCWYRAFPPRALTVMDVVRFGLAGTAGELRVILLLGLVAGALGMLVPAATGLIVARIIPAMEKQQLLLVMLALLSGAGAMSLMQFAQGIALLRIETKMDTAVEAGVWDRLLNLPTTFFRQYAAGDLALRALGIGAIRQALTGAALSSLLTFAFSSVAFALLFYLDLRLALVAVLAFLAIVAATLVAAVAQLKYEREGSQARGKVAGLVLQLLTGVSRLRVAGAENRAGAIWAKAFSRQTRLAIQAQTVANRLAAFAAAVPLLGSAAVFATLSLGPAGDLSLAAFLAFNAAFVQVLSAAAMMGSAATSVLGMIPLYERARPILQTLPEFHQAKRDPGELRGEIEVSHVAFRYHPDGPLILDDLSLQFRPGQFVALVGPSGAGKSTVLRLLLAFENPTSGSIYYDREDLAGLDHQAVRRQVGVVLQSNRLTPGDLMTNITGGSPQYTLDDAWEAARLAGLDEDIRQMPMGMFTVVSEGESTLSGGQRQRLLIARAIIDRPRILLFDEATSALDNVTQAQVSRSLENLKATRIVIAHRLSTIIHADCIYVLQRGRVVQQGTYQELAGQPGLFADLVRRQTL